MALRLVASILTGKSAETWDASPADWAWSLLAALLLAGNWALFIWAVQTDQVIAPTITLLLATAVYGETFTPGHAAGFGLVWVGLIFFTVDSVRRATAPLSRDERVAAQRIVRNPKRRRLAMRQLHRST